LITGKTDVGAKISEQAALTARLMLYGLLAIVMMAMDQRGQYVPRVRHLAGYLVEPLYYIIEWPVLAARDVFGFFRSSSVVAGENDRLREQLLVLRGDLQRLQTLSDENQRLRALLDGAASLQFDFQFAEMVDVDLDPFSHRVIIDRGANQDVLRGQAVIDGAGVIGQVEAVQLHSATVRLISDPNHALPVQINRTGLRTVAFGMGDTGLLALTSVPREADVRAGDLVVTSGLGGRFPAGYPVALVQSVDRQEGQMFARVLVRILAALDRGREVLLIKTVDLPQAEVLPVDQGIPEGMGDDTPAAPEADTTAATVDPAGADATPVGVTEAAPTATTQPTGPDT
jgi:rod shape-determining protein MreC